jgi:hypothetical protein
MLGIGPTHQRQRIGRIQQPVDGAIAQLPSAWRVQGLAGGQSVQHVEHAAVADQRNVLARVLRGDGVQRGGYPLVHRGVSLAAGGRPMRVALLPAQTVFGVHLSHLVIGQTLKAAKAALAQTRFHAQIAWRNSAVLRNSA